MTESQQLTIPRTLATTIAGVALLSAFCFAGLVASFVVDGRGGDGTAYLEFAGRFVTWMGALATGGTMAHGARHLGQRMPSGQDPE